MKKIKVFTSNDLDGAGALMFIKWAFDETCIVDYTISNIFAIKRDYEDFINSDLSEDTSKIFILNLIPNFKIEDKRVITICKSDGLIKMECKGHLEECTSTTKLLIKMFGKYFDELTIPQKKFLAAVNNFYIDGDYKKKNEGMRLNALLQFGRNKYSEFHRRFYNGLIGKTDGEKGITTEYSKDEQRIIANYIAKIRYEYESVELFEHKKKKGVYIALVKSMDHKHELLDLLFRDHSPKMIFLVDLENGFISVRKDDSLNMNMQKLCETLIQGRSLKNCAGGRFTEKFIDFSKAFM